MTTEVLNGAPPAGPASEQGTPAAVQTNAATTTAQTDGAGGGTEVPAPKTFTQEEVNDIVKRAKAATESKTERRVLRTLERVLPHQQQAPGNQQQPAKDEKPTRRDGETDDAYFDRLTDWKLEQRDRQQAGQRQQEQARTITQKTDKLYADAAKLQGFDRDTFDEIAEAGHLTKPMVEALIDSDLGAQLMHHLAANPAEAERISQLPPARQAAEVGKLEAKLAAAPTPKTSKAPDPHTPVGGNGKTPSGDPSKMSMDEYVAWRKGQGAAWAR